MPPSCPSPWRIPGCSASPTGRTPQERSRVPHHRSGVMSKCSPPTSSVPDQNPVCAKRIVSNSTRPYLRMYWRGSRNASIAPSQIRSQAMPCSVGSRIRRTFFSPSITSTRNGPTLVSMRSPSSREARTTLCLSPRRTHANASCTPRFGYCPIPMIRKSSSLHPCMLK